MKIMSLALCLALAGCSAAGTGPAASSARNDAARVAPAAAESPAAEIDIAEEYEIADFAVAEEQVECRREAPIGSRITIQRCYAKTPETPASAALNEIERQELEQLRQQQMWEEQQRVAREMALRQSLRRGAGR